MSTTTITIHGAGILGLSIAWALIGRGAQVRIIDPNGPAAGASGGIVGALAPHVPENWNAKKAFQFDSLVTAESFWTDVAGAAGQDPGYARTGRLQPVLKHTDLALAQSRSAHAKTLWQGRYDWTVIPDRDTPIQSPTGWLIRDTLTARIHPRRATQTLAKALQQKGAEFTDQAKGPEVWATGAAGLTELSTTLGKQIGMGIKGQAALFDLDLRDQPQLFVDGLHIVPHGNGTTAIGSTTERDFKDPTGTDAQLDTLIARARAALPALQKSNVIERWAGLRPRAKSRAPMLGHHPTEPGSYIANGGFKIGFGMAPKIAETMATLILDGTDTIPDSFKPEASL